MSEMPAACAAIIPARYASSRLPGKPLVLLAGKPMIVHVVERVRAAAVFDHVWVATDDERVRDVVCAAGAEAYLTHSQHATGTERIAELAARLPPDACVVNVQGDEPLVPPELLRAVVAALRDDSDCELITAAYPSDDAAAFASPHVVKVVVDAAGMALYFSRAPIPSGAGGCFLHHIGIYGFQRGALARFVSLPRGALEQREGLEQLRALEHGMRIRVLRTSHRTRGVDTLEDLKAVAKAMGAA
jgi:3-deoxy-manno-octulosonate cytidylyltransferase (CMP-KDO synthetase)